MDHNLGSFLTQDGDRLRDLEADQESAGRRSKEYRKQLAAADRHYQQFPTARNRRMKEICESLAARAAREQNLIADKFEAAFMEAKWQALAEW